MLEHNRNDPRTDVAMATQVEAGLALCLQQGLHHALQLMEGASVPRTVALRVLCSPRHARRRERRLGPRPVR